jgi:hypothetical protein
MKIPNPFRKKIDNNDIPWTDEDVGISARMYGEKETFEFAIIVAVKEDDALQVLSYMSERFGEKVTFCITSIHSLLQLRAYSKDGIETEDIEKFLNVVDAFVDGLHRA